MRTLIVTCLALCGALSAQTAAPGVSQPSLISMVAPEYSEEARMLGLNAVVEVGVMIGADGSLRSFRVARPVGFGLDEKAVQCVAKWRFKPGMKAGEPTDVRATVEVAFNMVGRMNPDGTGPREPGVPTARIAYPSTGGEVPVAISGRLPKYEATTPSTFHLSFEVSEKGDVEYLIATDGAPKQILEGVRKLHFKPATSAGQPIRARAKLELSYQ